MTPKPTKVTPDSVTIRWLRSSERAREVAHFFASNVEPSYVSHGELYIDRANAPGEWVSDLEDIVEVELREILEDANASTRIAIVEDNGVLIGIGLLALRHTALKRHFYGTIEDMIIQRSRRSEGLGHRLFEFLQEAARSGGAQALMLESGITNSKAHSFFDSFGLETISVVKYKTLAPLDSDESDDLGQLD